MKNMFKGIFQDAWKDVALGFRLALRSRTIKEDMIFNVIIWVLGILMLTGSAIAKNTLDTGLYIYCGVLFLAMGTVHILTDYNAVLYSNLILTSPHSKKLQIGIPLKMGMVLSLTGLTLIALIEMIFTENGGDIIFTISLFMGLLLIMSSGARRRYVLTVLLIIVPLMFVISETMDYFQHGRMYLRWGLEMMRYLRERRLAATGCGYLILMGSWLVQYAVLRLSWKKDGDKLFYKMKERVL